MDDWTPEWEDRDIDLDLDALIELIDDAEDACDVVEIDD